MNHLELALFIRLPSVQRYPVAGVSALNNQIYASRNCKDKSARKRSADDAARVGPSSNGERREYALLKRRKASVLACNEATLRRLIRDIARVTKPLGRGGQQTPSVFFQENFTIDLWGSCGHARAFGWHLPRKERLVRFLAHVLALKP